MPNKYTMHVVTHSHWDREWYKAFQHFRMRLVDMTDDLIELLQTDPEFKYFVFDGQTIVLDDYLEIRPENEEVLRKLVKEGRILIGPWYNQPDEFLVSGEGMIRNLMLGRKMGDDWGNWMRVGYVPDCFGHISQLPQIMRGFGIDNTVLFRGINSDHVKAEFTWRSPDGSEVLCVKMPDNNAYSNFYYQLRATIGAEGPIDFEQSRKELQQLFDNCVREKPTTSNMLFMDGVDHIFADHKTPAIIKDANENMGLGTLVHSTLPRYVEAVKAENPDLQVVEGELRWSNRAWQLQALLPNVMSSRIHLKQMNHECQTLLEKWAEPFSAIASTMGKAYPSSYLLKSWEYVLKNHPHDSICGCSIDQVHKDMEYRFDQARLIAEPIAQQSLQYIADKVNTSPMKSGEETTEVATAQTTGSSALPWEAVSGGTAVSSEKVVGIVVFNPLSWDRTEVVEQTLLLPVSFNEGGLQIVDAEGNEAPFKVLGPAPYWALVQPKFDIPTMPPAKPIKVAFLAEDVPSVGYKTFFVKSLDTPYRVPGSMVVAHNAAENEYLVLSIEADGTITVIDKETERVFVGGMMFEDGGDFGDGYNYVKPTRDTIVTSLGCTAQTSIVEDNICRAVFRVETTMPVPASRAGDSIGRSAQTADLKITSYVTLAKGVKRVDIVTEVDNTAKDHRLRVCFPSGVETEYSHAESLFDVIDRAVAVPECRDWHEPMPATHPQKSFVDVNDGEAGLTVINAGLPEYEVKDDAERNVYITLLRATGGGVGGGEAQVEGQLIGKHTFKYGLFPHACGWQDAKVWRHAWGHNVPMKVVQTGLHAGELPMTMSFLGIDCPNVVLSIMKKAEKTGEIVARVFNITESAAKCEVCFEGAGKIAQTDMNEEVINDTVGEGCATIEFKPKQIVTLAAEIRKG